MAPLFVIQEIPDCDIPDEIKIYKEKIGRKTVKGKKKLLGVMRAKKDFFVHFFDYIVFAAWFVANSSSSIG